MSRSDLSRTVPDVSKLKLVDALPEAKDLGPDWKADPDTLGREDYLHGLTLPGKSASKCKDADTWLTGTKPFSPHTAALNFKGPTPRDYVWVRIAVDSPGNQADRFELIRAVHDRCEGWKTTVGQYTDTITYEILDPPEVDADETYAVRITSRTEETDTAGSRSGCWPAPAAWWSP